MADQIAGLPKKYVYAGALVSVGILGYAYWRAGSASTTTDPAEYVEAAADEYDSPLGNSGTNSSLTSNGNVDPDAIDTNAKWTQAAVAGLQSVGYDAAKVSSALGKLLGFKQLTASEADIAQTAKGMFGEPPQGGPYPIKESLPTPTPTKPTVTLKAPVSLKATNVGQTTALIDWDEMKGNNGYRLTVSGGGINKQYWPLWSWDTIAGLKKNTKYTVSVCGRYPNGTMGPTASITITTKK